jgi:ceramide glucosyltransferase
MIYDMRFTRVARFVRIAKPAYIVNSSGVILSWIFGSLALLSLALLLWQWRVARRFPLHQRSAGLSTLRSTATEDGQPGPAIALLKPLKGCDAETEACLRSWLVQQHAAPIQILFGVASQDDPVCEIVRKLLREYPDRDAQLVVCSTLIGPNAKASKLAELERLAKHEVLVVSDADVRVPPDFLTSVTAPLEQSDVGMVTCFYRLANPSTLAMQWEAIAINADFWSHVLQSQSLKPLDFALGAVMTTRRKNVAAIGGFRPLANCLADDYQLGNRIARQGHRIALCPVVVDCWESPMTWRDVWKHQLRWARTIRVCQPVPYFFSILSNVTLWALVCFAVAIPRITVSTISLGPVGDMFATTFTFMLSMTVPAGVIIAITCGFLRLWIAADLQTRLTRSSAHTNYFWLVPIKDLLQFAIWLCAFAGNRIEWRGREFKLRRDGTLVET